MISLALTGDSRLRFCRLIVGLVLICCGSVARGEFTFVHVSDIHIGAQNNHETDAALLKEIAELNPKPAFIVNTGDVCENGTDEQYTLYQETMKNLGDVRAFVAPGNHDVRWNPRGKEGYTRGTSGPLYQSWDHENVHFVTLDSTVLLEHGGHISQEQLDWLKKDLEKVGTERPVVIGFHHPIGGGYTMVDNQQALIDLVAPYNVVLWLQGHGHGDVEWSVNGAAATMVKGLYQGSYDIITVTETEMKIVKRYQPEIKRELTSKEGEQPTSAPAPQRANLMTIPLKKPKAPKWTTEHYPAETALMIVAHKGELPADVKMEYRVDAEKNKELPSGGGDKDTWFTKLSYKDLTPGVHVVTVQATLPDKRAFQQPITIEVPGKVKPVWEVNVGGAIQSRLVRWENLLLVTTMGNDLVALDAASGQEKYRVRSGGPIFGQPFVYGETCYFGSADHNVYAVNARTGELKWKQPTGGAVLAGCNFAMGKICVGSVDTKIYGLDAGSGSVMWTVQGQNMYQTQTGSDGERFFVGSWDNHFRCIDAKEGQMVWDKVLGRPTKAKNFSPYAPAITSPAVGDGKVFISTNDGILHGIDINSGDEAWRIDWKKMGYSSPHFRDGKVYGALSDEGKTFRAEAATGKIEWTCETGSVIYDSSFCTGGPGMGVNAFIGNVNGTLNAINMQSGKLDYQYSLGPGHLLASPAADEEKVYIGNMSGKVVALPVEAKRDVAPASTQTAEK
jgi:outer membrane protein assembly factor BamB